MTDEGREDGLQRLVWWGEDGGFQLLAAGCSEQEQVGRSRAASEQDQGRKMSGVLRVCCRAAAGG